MLCEALEGFDLFREDAHCFGDVRAEFLDPAGILEGLDHPDAFLNGVNGLGGAGGALDLQLETGFSGVAASQGLDGEFEPAVEEFQFGGEGFETAECAGVVGGVGDFADARDQREEIERATEIITHARGLDSGGKVQEASGIDEGGNVEADHDADFAELLLHIFHVLFHFGDKGAGGDGSPRATSIVIVDA